MSENSKIRNLVKWLFIAATFFLTFRTRDIPFKVADILFVITGALVFFDWDSLRLIRRDWRSVWQPFVRYALLFVIAILIAQIATWLSYKITPLRIDVAAEYARLLLNIGVFFLTAFLIYSHGQKLISKVSTAILISFAAVLPAYIPRWQDYFISHDRLAGLLENPIVFGAWAMAAFLIGLGFFLGRKKLYAKLLLGIVLSVLANFILWSNTRSVWIALIVGVIALAVFYYLKDKNLRKIEYIISITLISFLAGYIIFAYTPQHHRTNVEERVLIIVTNPLGYQDRTIVWGENIPKTLERPIGFGLYGKEIPQGFPGSSNTYLEVMTGGGILALIASLLVVLRMISSIKAVFNNRSDSTVDDITMAWFALLPATLIVIFFFDFLLVRTIWFTLGAILGISVQKRA